jgi:hypothetical protein
MSGFPPQDPRARARTAAQPQLARGKAPGKGKRSRGRRDAHSAVRKDTAREPKPAPPVPVLIAPAVLEAARNAIPSAPGWSDAQLAAACLALVVRGAAVPRTGMVITE